MSIGSFDYSSTASLEPEHDPALGCEAGNQTDRFMNPSGNEIGFPYAIITVGTEGLIETWDESASGITGYTEAEMVGVPLSMLLGQQSGRRLELPNELRLALEDGSSSGQYLMRHKNGGRFVGELIATAIWDCRERLSGFSCMIRDAGALAAIQAELAEVRQHCGELQQAIDRIHEEKKAIRCTLASIGEAVITTDAGGTICFVNPVAEKLTGWSSNEACGRPVQQVLRLTRDGSARVQADPVNDALRQQCIVNLGEETVLIRRDGTHLAVQDSCAPVLDDKQKVLGTVLVFRDVTRSRVHARKVQHLATHDALTGLVNRIEFERRLERVLQTMKPDEEHVLFYLDLDHFKIINDTCGHLAGDELLRQVAAILKMHVRHRDTLARLGGDEFAVLLEHCANDQARRVADAISNALSRHQFVWRETSFHIGVSIGVLPLAHQESTASQVLGLAGRACYSAKQNAAKRICFHNADAGAPSLQKGLRYWEGRIQRAIAEDRFRLYFQPIVPLGPVNAAALQGEILLRLEGEDELLCAGDFLEPTERNGQMLDVDRWVIRNTLSSLNALRPPADSGPILVSINISRQSLMDDGFQDFVVEQLERLTLPMVSISLEVSEAVAVSNPAAIRRLAERLHRRRCRLGVDRFGAGLSSISGLRALPIDYLKIDRLHIHQMASDPIDTAIVETIRSVGHLLGIQTIAEAVETPAMLEKVRSAGLECAQGFGIARPIPLEEALTTLEPA